MVGGEVAFFYFSSIRFYTPTSPIHNPIHPPYPTPHPHPNHSLSSPHRLPTQPNKSLRVLGAKPHRPRLPPTSPFTRPIVGALHPRRRIVWQQHHTHPRRRPVSPGHPNVFLLERDFLGVIAISVVSPQVNFLDSRPQKISMALFAPCTHGLHHFLLLLNALHPLKGSGQKLAVSNFFSPQP